MAKRNNKYKKEVEEVVRHAPTWVIVVAIILAILIGAGYIFYTKYYKKQTEIEAKGEISFHFMMLGNKNTGDSIYIKAGNNDILIDAGSKTNSIDDIKNYLDNYVTDNKLEFVVATHADQDHIAGFSKADGSIFDLYQCEKIITFALTDKTTETYNGYCSELADEVTSGAVHYTALECYNNEKGAKRVYDLTEDGNVKMEILYNYYYENSSNDENNYSVCIMFHHGSRKFLFTGDLEKDGEEKLSEFYDFSQVELFKAGHHGSYTSSNECLLSEIKPKMSVVCCCAGSIERNTKPENLFPSQNFIDRMGKYTSAIYASTAMDYQVPTGSATVSSSDNIGDIITLNGNIQVISDAEKGVYVDCSNNNLKLKETEWFSKYRTWPQDGVN